VAFHLVSRFLLRAPLLPARASERAAEALREHPLGFAALALASPDLAAAFARGRPDARAAEALDRYGRRATFRPTPHGLLAGVAVGTLGARTALATEEMRAVVRPSWARLAALGRGLLDEPAVREGASLRVAPSLLAYAGEAVWLAFGADEQGEGLTVHNAEIDGPLSAVLEAAEEGASWPTVRGAATRAFAEAGRRPEGITSGSSGEPAFARRARGEPSEGFAPAAMGSGGEPAFALGAPGGGNDDDEIDEYLLVLVDQGLLCHDLVPPLVGPDPLAFMTERLAAPAAFSSAAAAALATLSGWGDSPRSTIGQLRQSLEALPGTAADVPPLHGQLLHEPRRATLSRPAVARAAELAPLLFRLQEALAPPAAERGLNCALAERLRAVTEVFGVGAFDLAALAVGGYGTAVGAIDEEAAPAAAPAAPLLDYLVGQIVEAARLGAEEMDLDAATLDELLPPGQPPPSFELLLTPCTPAPRQSPGEGWLLGLHAPAGASWGRFAHLAGAALAAALDELSAAEKAARPDERTIDVAFAPSPMLADLCTHPSVRPEALALLGWPEGGATALRPLDLALVSDPAASDPLALRRSDGQPVRPSPLHRVRSTNAPGGIYRLLAGWSLVRQHAPWALTWGALGSLPRLPRVRLGGFVVAPASWRIPPAPLLRGRGLGRWRQNAGLPRTVQVGREDELLLVDLDAASARRDLAQQAAHGRLYEIWPPLERLADQGGRRVEAVVAVVTTPEEGAPARAEPAREIATVPPPAERAPAPGWTTYKLFGAEERQDAVLLGAVGPLVVQARAAGEIDRWWFLRYVDGPGHRDHLRVRVRARTPADGTAFSRRLAAALVPLRAAGDVVSLETAEHFPETGRYGGPDTAADVEWLFELDSALVLRLLAAADEESEPPDGVELLVRSLDALTRGLGLDLSARRILAARRRAAQLAWVGAGPERRAALDAELRRRQRRLAAQLTGVVDDPCSAALDAHATRVQALFAAADRPLGAPPELLAALPAVLHVCAVRLLGDRPEEEAAAYFFWERTLEGLLARRRRGN
jgi:lantibiotic biosynthesis protein